MSTSRHSLANQRLEQPRRPGEQDEEEHTALMCLGLRVSASLLLVSAACDPVAAQSDLYLRGGLSVDWSTDTSFRDNDCARQQPPALFGCGLGEDDRPLAARGDFGSLVGIEGGIGYRFLPSLRVEGLVTYRPEFAFAGEANFLRTPGPQPVSAEVTSTTGMVVGYLDLLGLGFPRLGPLEPFVGAGIGASRHEVDEVEYRFPGLGQDAATVIQGGVTTDFSYLLTIGTAVRASERITFDVGYRYLDLGEVETEAGPATITRPSFTRVIGIDGTEADLTSHGVSATVRIQF
jgi:opacity protein-like surface antigen